MRKHRSGSRPVFRFEGGLNAGAISYGETFILEVASISSFTSTPPFFITGCPRSGTTLLQVILNRHPQICVPPELKLFFAYHRLPRWIRIKTLDRIRSDAQIPLKLTNGAATSTAAVYEQIKRELSEKYSKKIETMRFGDKTPEYAYRLRWVREVFPESKMVFVVRDPRAVALSLCRAPWLGCNLVSAASLWSRTQRLLHESTVWFPDDKVHWVRYEQLLLSPEHTLCELLAFLEIEDRDCVDEMMEPTPNDSGAVPERELEWKSAALSPINASRIDGWRDRSASEIQTIESHCYDELCRAGYAPVHGSNPGTWISTLRGVANLSRTAIGLPRDCWVSELAYRVRG